ncbi:uncharacterized protein ARMOST_18806 [Armillaria ostoyae]|uniref:Uncharacterized protein n=1 Tax=Armillaria ostoyae TaxID=47428 RepID=A0A284S2R5_ARMOS|nr:uncharacterized protein ARMOST_18806 [Armillaria ostoyae]
MAITFLCGYFRWCFFSHDKDGDELTAYDGVLKFDIEAESDSTLGTTSFNIRRESSTGRLRGLAVPTTVLLSFIPEFITARDGWAKYPVVEPEYRCLMRTWMMSLVLSRRRVNLQDWPIV